MKCKKNLPLNHMINCVFLEILTSLNWFTSEDNGYMFTALPSKHKIYKKERKKSANIYIFKKIINKLPTQKASMRSIYTSKLLMSILPECILFIFLFFYIIICHTIMEITNNIG